MSRTSRRKRARPEGMLQSGEGRGTPLLRIVRQSTGHARPAHTDNPHPGGGVRPREPFSPNIRPRQAESARPRSAYQRAQNREAKEAVRHFPTPSQEFATMPHGPGALVRARRKERPAARQVRIRAKNNPQRRIAEGCEIASCWPQASYLAPTSCFFFSAMISSWMFAGTRL